MQALFFGSTQRRLFGIYHPAQTSLTESVALLLCNPFGQEAVRTHRIYRVLAERVARRGVSVLRFDYFGSGDSSGSETEAELKGWEQDVLAANEELIARSAPAHLIWLGARLGGSIAANASTIARRSPNELILWEPVLDGRHYMKTLARGLVEALQSSLSLPPTYWQEMLVVNELEVARQGMGFAIGPELYMELLALKHSTIRVPSTDRCIWIDDGNDRLADKTIAAWEQSGLSVSTQRLEHEFNWLAEEALNTALVPTEIVQHLAAQITLSA